MMYMLRRPYVLPYLDHYTHYVGQAGLPGNRPHNLQPKVSWQHRNGVFLLRELLLDLQQHELHLAREQE